MKRLIIILLLLTAFIYGCTRTGNVVKDKNLTLEEAADLAMNKVYELTKNKEVIDKNGMSIYNSTYEGDKDRWFLVIKASHTIVKTYVYNNGTVKVLPTTLG